MSNASVPESMTTLLGRPVRRNDVLCGTGFDALNRVVGAGFPASGLWIVVGAPRQGVSTLLMQWAGTLALAGHPTIFASPTIDPPATARSIDASHRPQNGWDDAELVIARTSVFPDPSDNRLRAIVFDRPDRSSVIGIPNIRRQVRRGRLVLLGMPLDLIVAGLPPGSDLVRDWADNADLILQVRMNGNGPLSSRASEFVHLNVLLNRRGPLAEIELGFASGGVGLCDPSKDPAYTAWDAEHAADANWRQTDWHA